MAIEDMFKLGDNFRLINVLSQGYSRGREKLDDWDQHIYVYSPGGVRYECEDIGRGWFRVSGVYKK